MRFDLASAFYDHFVESYRRSTGGSGVVIAYSDINSAGYTGYEVNTADWHCLEGWFPASVNIQVLAEL